MPFALQNIVSLNSHHTNALRTRNSLGQAFKDIQNTNHNTGPPIPQAVRDRTRLHLQQLAQRQNA